MPKLQVHKIKVTHKKYNGKKIQNNLRVPGFLKINVLQDFKKKRKKKTNPNLSDFTCAMNKQCCRSFKFYQFSMSPIITYINVTCKCTLKPS